MKRFLTFLVVMGLIFISYRALAVTVTTGTVTKVITDGKDVVYQVTFGSTMTDDEIFKFGFTGSITKVVVTGTATDADGDLWAEDISDANYIQWTNPLASSKEIQYVIPATDISSNVYGGVPVAGTQEWHLTDMAGAKPVTIWIYCTKN